MKKGVFLAMILFVGLFFLTNADVPAAAISAEDSTVSSDLTSSGSWLDTIKSFFVYGGEKTKEKEPEEEKEEISGTALAKDFDKKQEEKEEKIEKKTEEKQDNETADAKTEDPAWINEEATGDGQFEVVIYDELTVLNPDEYTMDETQQEEAEETGELIGSSAIGAYYSGEASYNVQLAVDYHQGVYIPAGGMYSAFNVLGDGGESMGFHAAPGLLSDGTTEMMYGSGICPVTTAVYQAARNAGLTVLEVNDHVGAESAYAAAGDQAMFNYPTSDLKIQNDKPYGVTLYMGYYDGIIYAEWYGDNYSEY